MVYYIGDKNDAFDFGFWLSSCSGYHPKHRSLGYRVAYLYNFVGTIVVTLVAVQQAIATRNTISDFVQNLESASVFIMVFSKFLVPSFLDKNFSQFLDQTEWFWSLSLLGKQTKKTLETILSYSLGLEKLYYRFGLVTATLVVVSPFFLRGVDLPFGTFKMDNPTPESKKIRIVVQLLQSTLIPLWAIFAISTDCIFVGIAGNLIAQYRILNKMLMDLDFNEGAETIMRKLRVCVNHHNFLNAYCRRLQKTYSPIMLMQCLTSITIFSSEMYMVRTSFNIGVITRCVCMYCVILFEASVYCVLATLATDEAAKLTYSAYCSNWHNHHHSVPEKALVTIMSNCQQPVVFSAAGMMDVNLQTLVSVMKVSYSICMLLTVMNRK